MIDVSTINRTAPSLSRSGLIDAYNQVRPAYSRDTVGRINLGKQLGAPAANPRQASSQPFRPQSAPPASQPFRGQPAPAVSQSASPASRPPAPLRVPELARPVQRGQKTGLGIAQGTNMRLKVAFGWNVRDARCDVDASAFLLTSDRRVPSDDWFVFYGQPESPDGSTRLREDGKTDRKIISVDLGRLNPAIERIVFVMTIDEALEKRLNFGMIQDAWLRVLDDSGRELVSYRPVELYENITSMTLGELYLHRGEWRFNPVGNGVNTDLAGQCAVYGVNIGD